MNLIEHLKNNNILLYWCLVYLFKSLLVGFSVKYSHVYKSVEYNKSNKKLQFWLLFVIDVSIMFVMKLVILCENISTKSNKLSL